MQTHLSPAHAATPQGQQAEAVLRSCVHCGFCNATCPTYRLTGDELDGPRGRIYLMKQVFEGTAPTRTTQQHLDRCIGCRHCETTCPSGVQYNALLAVGQQVVDDQVTRPRAERWLRLALRTVLPSPTLAPLVGAAVRTGRALRPWLPTALARHVPATPDQPARAWPSAAQRQAHARQMILPHGCVQPHLRPHIDAATARVLDAVGVGAIPVRAAGCCGALKGHLGDEAGARVQARANIDAWWPLLEAGAEAVLINASGCGAWVKDYATLLANDPAYADKARQVVARLRDPAELLPDWVAALQPLLRPGPGPQPSGAAALRVAFHPPCSFSHVLKLSAAGRPGPVEAALRELGFDVRLPTTDSHQCCGAGGAYNLLQGDLSNALRETKAQALSATGATVVASANIGCISHLQAGMSVPVKHWIELIDDALAG